MILTDIDEVRAIASQYLIFACAYIFLSFGAFQLDGIFIGTSQTKDMRNAAILSAGVFLLVCGFLVAQWQNAGLWLAFILFLVARAGALLLFYPKLRKSI